MSYVYDRHVFHYIVEDGLVYLCMADEEFGRRVPFAFLEDIKGRWINSYGDRGQTALAYQMNEDFMRILQKQMDYFSSNPNADRINKVRGEIDQVKSVMVDNIEKVLERGEKIELLVDKAENLNEQAFRFKKQSTNLKRSMWWKNAKFMALIFLVVAGLIFFVAAGLCGGLDFNKCSSGHSEATTTVATTTSVASEGPPLNDN